MADRPILFSTPMVRALLEGRKSQTRRVLTKLRRFGPVSEFGRSDTPGYDWHFRDRGMRWHDLRSAKLLAALPFAAGDRLYVREAWHAARGLDSTPPRDIPRDADIEHAATARSYAEIGLKGKLRPAMFLPRWASRLTLIVTDVRVQRLQAISKEDAIAEGATSRPCCSGFGGRNDGWSMDWSKAGQPSRWARSGKELTERDISLSDPISAFASYINELHDPHWNLTGDGIFGKNPWVLALTFTMHHGNIDQIGGEA